MGCLLGFAAGLGSAALGCFLFVLGLFRALRSPRVNFARDQGLISGHKLWASGLVLMLLVAPVSCVVLATPVLFPEIWLPRVAERGDTIVAALRRFETDHGRPPQQLHELVPAYLAAIPGTGYWGDDEGWEYRRGESSWSLCVPINGMPIDFDEFWYSPDTVPQAGYRRWVRHGAWLYLDD